MEKTETASQISPVAVTSAESTTTANNHSELHPHDKPASVPEVMPSKNNKKKKKKKPAAASKPTGENVASPGNVIMKGLHFHHS